MGYTQHRFFIVHSWSDKDVAEAHRLASETFGSWLIGPIMEGVVNDAHGFIVWTSGSKLGWPEDEQHRAKIAALIEKMSMMEHPPHWVLVTDGEDLGDLSSQHGQDGDYTHKYETYTTPSEDEP